MHYYEDVVHAETPGDGFLIAPYGDVQEALTDSSGQFVTMPSDVYWVAGYTNVHGCYNPEPATSGTPSVSPGLRPIVVPYILGPED